MLGHIKIVHQPSSCNNSMGGSRTNTLAGRRSFKVSLTTKADSLIYHLLNKFSITLKFMRSSNRKNSVTSYFVLFFRNQNAFVAIECLITLKTNSYVLVKISHVKCFTAYSFL